MGMTDALSDYKYESANGSEIDAALGIEIIPSAAQSNAEKTQKSKKKAS